MQLCLKGAYNHCNKGVPNASATTFRGSIGSKLESVEERPIVDGFKKIKANFPLQEFPTDTSSDQKYLIDISKVIATGVVPNGFDKRKTGALNEARWTTLANRVQRHYVSQPKPSADLQLMSEFIQKVKLIQQ